ncbi:oxidoreductase, partial [Nocardia sp. NPDC058497]|uniref:oxidoreductase n=1 Tax=Nocardia sp. NPDC058497 TaxID=3346529 RepID=UPI003653ABF2
MSTPAFQTLTLANDLTITRMGYGAMQLTGRGVFGPPKDRTQAIAVLRAAIELGITHIDTSDFYGPVIVNELIREALRPYPADLRIVTKVGVRRTATGGWMTALNPADLKAQVHDNLQHLGLDALDVVNLRTASFEADDAAPIAEQFGALADLREQGLIRNLGLSGVTDAQLTEAQAIAPVVMVQNLYNLANRADDDLIDRCAEEDIAYAAFFPLGGSSPLRSRTLNGIARRLGATPQQVTLAWLL